MDVRWFQDLQSPQRPGIFRLSDSQDQIMVFQYDIDRSLQLGSGEIRCSCVPHVTDADGNAVLVIARMAPWPCPFDATSVESLRSQTAP